MQTHTCSSVAGHTMQATTSSPYGASWTSIGRFATMSPPPPPPPPPPPQQTTPWTTIRGPQSLTSTSRLHFFRPFRTVASYCLSSHPLPYSTRTTVVTKDLSVKESSLTTNPSSKAPSRAQRRTICISRQISRISKMLESPCYGTWRYRMGIQSKSSTHHSHCSYAAESMSYGAAQRHSRATRGRETREGQ